MPDKADKPRQGIRCPRCQSGRWQLGMTPAKMPRAWCRKLYGGCGHSWAPENWGWRKGPFFAPIPPERIATLERLLAAGFEDKRMLMAAAGMGKHSLRKYSQRWKQKQHNGQS